MSSCFLRWFIYYQMPIKTQNKNFISSGFYFVHVAKSYFIQRCALELTHEHFSSFWGGFVESHFKMRMMYEFLFLRLVNILPKCNQDTNIRALFLFWC